MLVAPTSASARLFTVCNLISCPPSGSSLSITDATSGVIGSIDPVLSAIGTVGNFDGVAPDFVNNDFFIFDLTLAAGSTSIDSISVTLLSGAVVAGDPITTGYFADAGKQDPNGLVVAWGGQEILNVPNCGLFCGGTSNFSFNLDGVAPGSQGVPAGYVQAGETTVRLFAIFNGPTALEEFDAVSFMISPVGAADYTVQGQIIPEPGTILLLGSGLVALGIGGRRRRGRRP